MSSSRTLCTPFETMSLMVLGYTNMLACLANEPQGSSSFSLRRAGITHNTAHAIFIQVLGFELRSSGLAKQVLY